jgi:uncharacterized protein YegJ (DUF2314 family)
MLFLYLQINVMRYYGLLIILLVFVGCNGKDSDHSGSSGKIVMDTSDSKDHLYQIDADDIEMNSAIDSAQKTLYVFDIALRKADKNSREFSIKKRYKAANGGGEHIWITDILLFKEGYKGVVNNIPVQTNEIKLGDTVFVDKKDITDWLYVQNNVLRGGFTIRVELKHMTPKEREETLQEMDYKIED